MRLVPHSNERRETINVAGNQHSELPLTSFDVTYPGLAAVKIDMFYQLTSLPNIIRETETEQEGPFKAFN